MSGYVVSQYLDILVLPPFPSLELISTRPRLHGTISTVSEASKFKQKRLLPDPKIGG